MYVPDYLLFQWHITELCNLNCVHCYAKENRVPEIDYDSLLHILDQYKRFLTRQGKRIRGHINITGGEPFLRSDFMDLLTIFSKNKNLFSFAILTNGTMIDKELAAEIKRLAPVFVQISIDGTETTHDEIRCKGSFEKAVNGITNLNKAGVKTYVSFTAMKSNYKEFPEVAGIARKIKASVLWTDRFIPLTSVEDEINQVLDPEETKKYVEIIYKEKKKADWTLFNKTEIRLHRALQFLKSKKRPYSCSAGKTLLAALPNGDLCPCRRMPIIIGNLLSQSMTELYHNSEMLIQLRESKIPDICLNCFYSSLCRGGLKCLSHALTGSPFSGDPGCWKTVQGQG